MKFKSDPGAMPRRPPACMAWPRAGAAHRAGALRVAALALWALALSPVALAAADITDDDDLPPPAAEPLRGAPAAARAASGTERADGNPAEGASAPAGAGGASATAPAPAAAASPAAATAFVPVPQSAAARIGDAQVVEARDALRRRDRARLESLRAFAMAQRHPLAMWVDYWELSNRLAEAGQEEFAAFSARWRDTYVEDRLRNDWLLELGKRRDWANFAREKPRFRMNDDREVACYDLMLRHQAGEDVRAAARAAWFAQREADDGCALMAQALTTAGRFGADDAWLKARQAMEAQRPRVARQAVGLVSEAAAAALGEVLDNPARYLVRRAQAEGRVAGELAVLALTRIAAGDPNAAAVLLDDPWRQRLAPEQVAWLWASIGRQAAQKLLPEADTFFQRSRAALPARSDAARAIELADDTLAWKVRAALRAGPRWAGVLQAVHAMSEREQREPAWVYWRARALLALATPGEDGAAQRAEGHALLAGIARQLNFYGRLAAEDLHGTQPLPDVPAPPSADERAQAQGHAGLTRSLLLIDLGLRSEGVREWNYSLRGMDDRALLAAAQRACDRAVWDRCISTSERTRGEIDVAQRFPLAFRDEVLTAARGAGLDAALVYGLIRQESRFVTESRSGAGASGLMQLMPATARIVARKLGVDYAPGQINDPDTNLKLGTGYLRMVLDDFEGSPPLAAAAYNAGPNRPRRWREGPVMEPAAWAENIPFAETRDYVKKVLANAVYYAARLGHKAQSLRERLGARVGPRAPDAPPVQADLP